MNSYRAAFRGDTEELQNLCESITDCHHSTPIYTPTGKLVVRNFNIKNGRMLLDDISFTDDAHFEQRTSRALPQSGDLIITREAPMGEVCVIPNGLECCLGQRMVLIKPDLEKVDNQYLLYSLMSEYAQTQIGKSDRTGSIVSNLRIPLLKELLIPYRELAEQRKIGGVLAAIDKKIELNNKINAELEAMAKLIYDYWFVQFDFPDASGKPYKSSGGKMVYNETLKREIPDGWSAAALSTITTVSKASINPADYPEKDFKLFSIPVFDASNTFGTERGDTIGSNKFIVKESDLLVSKLNPWFNRVVYVMGEEDQICSTEFVVWRCPKTTIKNFMYLISTSPQFIAHCTQSATGTSNSHKRVNPDVMMRFEQPFDLHVAEHLGGKLDPILKKLIVNQRENTKLAALRDWLLPMLMNGQVTVKEA